MKLSRRAVLQASGLTAVIVALLPRVAFAARNALRNVRTGIQPGNKTRLVIETSERPSYSTRRWHRQWHRAHWSPQ